MLQEYSAKQIRFMFLLHNWNILMNYSPENSFPEAIAKEEKFNSFFKNVKAILRQCDIQSTVQKWNDKDEALQKLLFDK